MIKSIKQPSLIISMVLSTIDFFLPLESVDRELTLKTSYSLLVLFWSNQWDMYFFISSCVRLFTSKKIYRNKFPPFFKKIHLNKSIFEYSLSFADKPKNAKSDSWKRSITFYDDFSNDLVAKPKINVKNGVHTKNSPNLQKIE